MQDNAEDIDLEYLSEDFPKLLNSMKGATDRIKGISTSLRSFSRADTDKGVGKGTGLGLAIARQIVVEKHGGSLDVRSELDQGTEFCIRLPIGVA